MLNVLSLGAGVQSSTMALMAQTGELPKPDCAIFADTQNEPRHTKTMNPRTGNYIEGGVYGWLDWLKAEVDFPIYTVTAGDLFEANKEVRVSKKTGKKYMKSLIPAFTLSPEGKIGLLGRKCTTDFKIIPIQRKVRELLGIKRGGKEVLAIMQIGISTDEAVRMKDSRVNYIKNEWPLIDMGMSRQDCFAWLKRNNYPVAPRSACIGCPFHSDHEWRKLKETSPADFSKAVRQEKEMQEALATVDRVDGVPYLHGSCEPLDTIDFANRKGYGQLDLFGNECEGLCGV